MLKIANAPVSWGVIENVEGARTGYEQVLDEIAATGYQGTELGDWGFLPTDPEALRSELEIRDLALLGSWVGVAYAELDAHASGEAQAVRVAGLMHAVACDQPFIVLGDDHSSVPLRFEYAGRIGPEHALDAAGWKNFTQGVNRIARAVRKKIGLRSVFHHHCATWVETPEETRKLLDLTDPEYVGLCLDTGHCRFGGGDPLTMLHEHADRIWHVHFKDFDPEIAARARLEGWNYRESVRHGVFCELGDGDVDFPAVVKALDALGYDGWIVVEQDVLPGMGSPKESARRSREYLRGIGL